jgi:hypothetical protein
MMMGNLMCRTFSLTFQRMVSGNRWLGVDENGDASVPCPLKYSEQEHSLQKEEYAKWERDIERKGRVLDEIGLYAGWNGAVSPQDYDEVVRRLAAAKDRFLTRESTNEQDKALREEV